MSYLLLTQFAWHFATHLYKFIIILVKLIRLVIMFSIIIEGITVYINAVH